VRSDGRDPAADDELHFAGLIRDISRAVSHATRALEDLPTLSDSQVEAIRLLVETGGATPTELAGALGLSRPTVSDLIRRLEEDDLVVRRRSRLDGRSVVVTPTERAKNVLDAFRRGRLTVIVNALHGLEPAVAARLVERVSDFDLLLAEVEKAEARYRDGRADTETA
jgi:DNA-binding MarR family transcriptional regulator